MDRKKELRIKFLEQKTLAGVFQIKNMKNQKCFVDSTRNINGIQRQRFMLEHDAHPNKSLQVDWNKFGATAFMFETLEVLEKEPAEYYDLKDALKKLKEKWMHQLQPFGDKGYNRIKTPE